jgi:hypothetical protein
MTTTNLQIGLTPELLDEGPDYERAAFGRLEIVAGDQMLAALVDAYDGRRNYQPGPYVSGYHFAEWLVWNWWRLRWEPRSSVDKPSSFEWDMAHRMADIGEGYLWPNITISCDGFQCDLISGRSHEQDTPLFSYIGAPPITVPAMELENAVDQFVDLVLQRLADAGIAMTNLQTLWNDLSTERNDREVARFRRIEALMGFEPDETDEALIESWIKDVQPLGENALDELATGAADSMLSAQHITDTTALVGFDINTNDALRLDHPLGMQWGQTAAWRVGVAAANAVRQQAGLSDQLVSDSRLAELAGVSNKVLKSDQCTNTLSWVFHTTQNSPRIALRQWRKTGRRFDVARLIGDWLFSESAFTSAEPLSPATRSYSYRQKAQRAFAAELLSPWETVRDMLGDDYSSENQEHVAEHFAVSPLTISTLLVNNEGYGPYRHGELAFI